MKNKLVLLEDLKAWLTLKSEIQPSPMKERCAAAAEECQRFMDEVIAIWDQVKTVEKKVSRVSLPFDCQRCGTYMPKGSLRTAIWEGDKDAAGNWTHIHDIDIQFLCETCMPITEDDRRRLSGTISE